MKLLIIFYLRIIKKYNKTFHYAPSISCTWVIHFDHEMSDECWNLMPLIVPFSQTRTTNVTNLSGILMSVRCTPLREYGAYIESISLSFQSSVFNFQFLLTCNEFQLKFIDANFWYVWLSYFRKLYPK